jgi:hypothetical protein
MAVKNRLTSSCSNFVRCALIWLSDFKVDNLSTFRFKRLGLSKHPISTFLA